MLKQTTIDRSVRGRRTGVDGIFVDIATGYIGIIATRFIGQSTTRVATFTVR